MRCINRLRFWRTFLTKKNGKQHNGCNGQKFALPVLECLKPKISLRQVIANAILWLTVQYLLFVMIDPTAVQVKAPAKQEQERENDKK